MEQFKDDFPGRDWIKLFLGRHSDLSARFVAKNKKFRAKVTPEEVLTECVDRLTVILDGVLYM